MTISSYNPGDFILTKGDFFYSKVIRFGQKLHYHEPFEAQWNHAATIVEADGTLVEAINGSVRYGNINEYLNSGQEIMLVSPKLQKFQRNLEVGFVEDVVGDKYGWLTIVSISFQLLFHSPLGFSLKGTEICSALVAKGLEHAGVFFGKDVSTTYMMPAGLCKFVLQKGWKYQILNQDSKK